MAWRSFSDSSRGDERLLGQLPQLLRQHRPDLMVGEGLYRSPAGFTSWSAHWVKAVAVELALEQSESIADHVGIWGAMVCQWAREIGAEPRFLSPALAQAFLQTEQPTLTPALPRGVGVGCRWRQGHRSADGAAVRARSPGAALRTDAGERGRDSTGSWRQRLRRQQQEEQLLLR